LSIATIEALDREGKDSWTKFLVALSSIWGITTGITTIGTLPFLGYSREALHSLTALHIMLDIRFILGVFLLALIVGLAFHAAIQENLPSLPHLRTWSLRVHDSHTGSILGMFILPFMALANVLLMALSVIVDLIMKVGTISATYLLRVGKHTTVILREVIMEKEVGRHTLRFIGLFLCILLLVLLGKSAINPSIAYITSSQWSIELSKLFYLTLIGTLMIPCTAAVSILKENRLRAVHHPTAFGLAMVLAILLVAGGIVHGLSKIDVLKVNGFNGIGPYTILILLLVGAGAVKLLLVDKD